MLDIHVDADACPKVVREILFKAAVRANIALKLVANQTLQVPPSPLISMIQVQSGFDVADDYIVQHIQSGDLAITSDIPLAAEIIDGLIERAAKLVAANIASVVLKSGKAKSHEKPVLMTIEGTTFYKLHKFMGFFHTIKQYALYPCFIILISYHILTLHLLLIEFFSKLNFPNLRLYRLFCFHIL